MRITYKNFQKINFPLFKIESDNLELADGILWLDNQVVDDRNMPGKTLGIRRAQSPFKVLYKVKGAVPDVSSLIRNSAGTYLDNYGNIIFYEKTTFAQLKYYRIRKIQKRGTESMVWVGNINFPFIVPRPPAPGNKWAGVLHIKGVPWILYSFSETRQKTTRRKI